MVTPRLGNQTPTSSVVESYSETVGAEAIELYNSTGRTAQPWQELLIYDILALNNEGLWVHTKFGYSIPRRNGKNEVVIIREMYGLVKGEKILHTAHRTATSHSAWERLGAALAASGLKEGEDYTTTKQLGFETIKMANGGSISFRTRSSKGGLGEGFDLLIIDEAQEYTEDQESALKYVVADAKNPQIIFCGTPPTAVSSGTVFPKLRASILSGNAVDSAWEEWGVEYLSDQRDKELWYKTNPSLGTVLTERKITAEIGTDEVDFNIQRLGLWIKYNQKSAISSTEWSELATTAAPKLNKTVFAGVKFGVDGSNAALSIAVKTSTGKVFIETLDCQPMRNGLGWIIKYLSALKPSKIVADGANGQELLSKELKRAGIKGLILPTVKEIIAANSQFEQAVYNQTLCHANQPALSQAASNCEKRAIGSGGGFGYRAQKEGIEIALLDSAILAFWVCAESKEKRKQQVRS